MVWDGAAVFLPLIGDEFFYDCTLSLLMAIGGPGRERQGDADMIAIDFWVGMCWVRTWLPTRGADTIDNSRNENMSYTTSLIPPLSIPRERLPLLVVTCDSYTIYSFVFEGTIDVPHKRAINLPQQAQCTHLQRTFPHTILCIMPETIVHPLRRDCDRTAARPLPMSHFHWRMIVVRAW